MRMEDLGIGRVDDMSRRGHFDCFERLAPEGDGPDEVVASGAILAAIGGSGR